MNGKLILFQGFVIKNYKLTNKGISKFLLTLNSKNMKQKCLLWWKLLLWFYGCRHMNRHFLFRVKENYNMDVAYWDKEKLPSGNLSDLA